MYRDIVKKTTQAVVMISCPDINSKGSGFIISQDGYVITNNHVVSELKLHQGNICLSYSSNIIISINGTDSPGRLVIDPNGFPPVVYDYAILKVEGVNDLPFLELGNPDEVMPGDNILCLGYPLDFKDVIVTDGIISAVLRRPSHINSLHQLRTVVTNAIIHFGNSGGPMIHADSGKVVGINTLSHELSDVLYNRLASWCQHPGASDFVLIRDIVKYSLKYTYVGFNHAVSIEHVANDAAMPNLKGGIK